MLLFAKSSQYSCIASTRIMPNNSDYSTEALFLILPGILYSISLRTLVSDFINSAGVGSTHKPVNSVPAQSLPCSSWSVDSGSMNDRLYCVSKV